MITITPLEELGRAEHGWLSARFHFSFAEYYNPRRMGFGPLRVWNDDLIRAGGGFPMHPHRDMEIITYIRTGAIAHEDNQGNRGVTHAGDVQVMSAGTGVHHSEFSHGDEDTTLFQIWVKSDRKGHAPRWETRKFPAAERQARLTPLASGRRHPQDEGHDGALMIHQDAALYCATLNTGQGVTHVLEEGRRAYLVPARGTILVNGQEAPARAGVEIEGESGIKIEALEDAEVVLLDLP